MSLSQYDDWTVDEIVTRNPHSLTAMHILSARQYILAQRQQAADDIAALKEHLDDAHRIGLAVLRAKRAGRKSIRIADVAGDQ